MRNYFGSRERERERDRGWNIKCGLGEWRLSAQPLLLNFSPVIAFVVEIVMTMLTNCHVWSITMYVVPRVCR